MAEEQEKEEAKEGSAVDATAEFERTLSDADEVIGASKVPLLKKKKFWIPAIAVLVLILAGGIYWFLSSNETLQKEELAESGLEEEAPTEEEVSTEEEPPAEEEKLEEIHFKKVNSYQLEPFFIPLGIESSEENQFIRLQVTFILSNRKLNLEIDKNIGVIRRKIYILLKNKNPEDYIRGHIKLKQKLKQEMITVSNNILANGVGTVSDVLFINFILK